MLIPSTPDSNIIVATWLQLYLKLNNTKKILTMISLVKPTNYVSDVKIWTKTRDSLSCGWPHLASLLPTCSL